MSELLDLKKQISFVQQQLNESGVEISDIVSYVQLDTQDENIRMACSLIAEITALKEIYIQKLEEIQFREY